jgi:hypothetical protein
VTRWQVVLTGKWGGTRSITLDAHGEKDARLRARALAFGHERISAVYPVKS